MVFQDPYDSLNPRLPVGSIIAEPLAIHGIGDRDLRRRKAAALAEQVGIHNGESEGLGQEGEPA
jgi:peptide/nickel transport system ATP-binding protein